MRSFAAVVAGALLAVGAAFVLNACAAADPGPVHKPLQVTSPPARP
ncbi:MULTISPECIES: hypothetical protein [Embleya]|uniref:Lipoprotein n=1 Tax=Embleya hyalina TaxID=516124 RepID=A0A401YYB0_9ACTN|nr:hypothetical protein [Embleya hyalina]GCD99475.1 hypothetical protein EHYA_07197 [Embleya hyalina]